jgi:predicted RNase H-like HicB family nuclease
MTTNFTAVFVPVPEDEGGGFMAYAEELPGAVTQGETIEEARENLKDAIGQVIEANRELRAGKAEGLIREQISVAV